MQGVSAGQTCLVLTRAQMLPPAVGPTGAAPANTPLPPGDGTGDILKTHLHLLCSYSKQAAARYLRQSLSLGSSHSSSTGKAHTKAPRQLQPQQAASAQGLPGPNQGHNSSGVPWPEIQHGWVVPVQNHFPTIQPALIQLEITDVWRRGWVLNDSPFCSPVNRTTPLLLQRPLNFVFILSDGYFLFPRASHVSTKCIWLLKEHRVSCKTGWEKHFKWLSVIK